MKHIIFPLTFVLFFTSYLSVGLAVEPEEILDDPVLEERAREISAELRCLVCQNQSIDDSDAQLAKDLRVLVRDRLTKGESDDEIMSYIVSRYGEFVLLKPPFNASTYVLWIGPPVFAAIGLLVLFMTFRRNAIAHASSNNKQEAGLSEAEQKTLVSLLDDTGSKKP